MKKILAALVLLALSFVARSQTGSYLTLSVKTNGTFTFNNQKMTGFQADTSGWGITGKKFVNSNQIFSFVNGRIAGATTPVYASFPLKADSVFTSGAWYPLLRIDSSKMYFDHSITFDPTLFAAPADATTYFFGGFQGVGLGVTAQRAQVLIPYNCILVGYTLSTRNSITSTTEASSLSVRLNNSTDVLLSSAVAFAANGAINTYSSTALSTNYTAGDLIELKLVTPTWVTNPTNIGLYVTLYFKFR